MHDILVALKARLALTDEARKAQIARDQVSAKVFDSSQNIKYQLKKIKEVYRKAKILEILEVISTNALESFLAVFRNLNTNYTTTQDFYNT